MKQMFFTNDSKGPLSSKRIINSSGQNIPINRRNNRFHHIPVIRKMVSKIRARIIFKNVKSALEEVDLIEKGIKKHKSLDRLLNEL